MMIQLSALRHEQKRKTVRNGGIILGVLALFYALICTPVYIFLASDVTLANTVLPQIWDVVQDATQLAFYWISFAFVIYLSAKFSIRESRPMLGVFACCSFGRYFLSLMAGYVLLAGSSGWDSLGEDLLYLLIDLLGDALLMGLVFILIVLILKPKKIYDSELDPSAKQEHVLHFPSLFDRSNAVLRCILFAALVPAVLRIASRIRFDLFFGAPQNKADLIWMILSYCGDICSWLIGYLVIFLVIHRMNQADEPPTKVSENQ